MNKKIKYSLFFSLSLLMVSILPLTSVATRGVLAEDKTYHVDFFNNYLREEFTLSNGTTGKGNSLLFKTVEVSEGSLLTKPDDPTRKNYEFQGWFKEDKCENIWDFTTDKVNSNLRLFAKWGLSSAEEIVEPAYTIPSTVLPESESSDYVINSIMNFKIENNIIKLPSSALLKLEASKTNILPLMEYKVKASKSITATFDNNVITVICGETIQTITVTDNSTALMLSNSTYETKAKNYEKNAVAEESYHVMLAGSSSIEFWESSKEDLAPIVSYNHGIGGTTVEQWSECLNQRLVYPYKPKMVVYYVGINNVINSKETAENISNRLTKLFNDTHAALPDTKVQYILMNLIPNYSNYFETIKTVNAAVVEYQKSNQSWLTLINPGDELLKDNGQPNAAYFRTDGLHLSYYGYVIWGGIIKESILEGLENM